MQGTSLRLQLVCLIHSHFDVQVLCKAFQHYEGFQMGRMVKNKTNNKNKGAAGEAHRLPACLALRMLLAQQ